MRLNRDKMNVAVARKALTVTNLARKYGVNWACIDVILNSREVTAICAGRMTNGLEVNMTEISGD